MLAAQVGDEAIARALLERGAAVDARDPSFGQTALMIAARDGHAAVASVLLDAGADANAQTRAEEPPRFIPPSESPPGLSKGVGIIRAGWPEGRGKRFPSAGSKTPLLYAARDGRLDVVRILLERGASLELADGNGVTCWRDPASNNPCGGSSVRVLILWDASSASASIEVDASANPGGGGPSLSPFVGVTCDPDCSGSADTFTCSVTDEDGNVQTLTGTVSGGGLTGTLTIHCSDGSTGSVTYDAAERPEGE